MPKFAYAFIAVLWLNSCKVDRADSFEPYDWPVGKIDRLLSDLRQNPEQHIGTGSDTLFLENDKYDLFCVPPLVFQDDSGELISGDISLMINSFYTKSDFIVNGIPSLSSNGNIEMHSAYRIQANNISGALSLAANKAISLKATSSMFNDKIELYYGDNSSGFFFWEEADMDFNVQDNVTATSWNSLGTGYARSGYLASIEQISWLGLGSYLQDNGASKPRLCLSLPDGYDSNNTVAFLTLDNNNVAIQLYFETGIEQFCKSFLPGGHSVTITTLTNFNSGDYRVGQVKLDLTQDEEIMINPVTKSISEIQQTLLAL